MHACIGALLVLPDRFCRYVEITGIDIVSWLWHTFLLSRCSSFQWLCGFDICYFLQAQHSDSLLAQHKLLHLATGRHRIGRDTLEVARNLLMADLACAILAQLLLGKRLSL